MIHPPLPSVTSKTTVKWEEYIWASYTILVTQDTKTASISNYISEFQSKPTIIYHFIMVINNIYYNIKC
jgi:hypothetical protein